MNTNIEKLIGKRLFLSGVVGLIRFKDGYPSFLQEEVELLNITNDNGIIIFEESCLNYTNKMRELRISKGDMLSFNAKIVKHEFIVNGFRNTTNGRSVVEYRMMNPSKFSLN